MIFAVTSVLNESDIITSTITHLLASGVDQVIVSVGESDLTTYAIILTLPDTVTVTTQTGPFDQGLEITRLSHEAARLGATWIIPFDADEFWYGDDGRPIDTILNEQPPSIVRVHAPVYTHTTWNDRYLTPKLWGKVAFRPHPEMVVAWGNHTVFNGHGDSVHGILAIRELQYRNYPHFLAKMDKARALFDSWDVPAEHGSHMRQLIALGPEDRYPAYQAYLDVETVHDPIPYRGT